MNVWVWIDRYEFLINIPIFGTLFTRNRTSCSLPGETGGKGIENSKNLELGGSVVVSRTWGLCWAVVTLDILWCKSFGMYFTVGGSVRILLLGKSLQVLVCRSGAGSVEQKIPTGRQGTSCGVGHGPVWCSGGSSGLLSPCRSEELFMPNMLPERVVSFSHLLEALGENFV